jgi:transcriptional regulator with XRE-family HTH domain
MALDGITSEAVKAARLLTGWSQYDLACEARISFIAVYAFEHGWRISHWLILSMREALEDAGIEFPEGRPPQIRRALRSIFELEAPLAAEESVAQSTARIAASPEARNGLL